MFCPKPRAFHGHAPHLHQLYAIKGGLGRGPKCRTQEQADAVGDILFSTGTN